MISQKEIDLLNEILDSKVEVTLDYCFSLYQKAFNSDYFQYFRPCYCLINMFNDNVSFYLLISAFYLKITIYSTFYHSRSLQSRSILQKPLRAQHNRDLRKHAGLIRVKIHPQFHSPLVQRRISPIFIQKMQKRTLKSLLEE